MRRFHSYGPVDSKYHFCVERKELICNCTDQLAGKNASQGHYFTMWAPHQTGKTWLMRQVKQEIELQYLDQFQVGMMSMQGVIMDEDQPVDVFLNSIPRLINETFKIKIDKPQTWDDFRALFDKKDGLFDSPVILFIDEFDSLPSKIIDHLVILFRDMYLKQDAYLLHGLALIGVRAVLGIGSKRGSPFNIQRSLHVPSFSRDEVFDLLLQYEKESSQKITHDVKKNLYEVTKGQPGLVGWFGELLTEKYNPGSDSSLKSSLNSPLNSNKVSNKKIEVEIDLDAWDLTYKNALHTEWNNTVLNIIAKAKGEYQPQILRLFTNSEMSFSLRSNWCSYLYMNGIIDSTTTIDSKGVSCQVCRFANPFIQQCLYVSLTHEISGESTPILPLEILDDLADIFEKDSLDVPALVQRYRDYLERLKAKGINPWKEQPRRTDAHIREASGHFHLYHWLMSAVGRRCIITPEFPTGNGKVDLFLNCNGKEGLIEVKSFIDLQTMKSSKNQAVRYAESINLDSVTIALFVPTDDENIIQKLSTTEIIEKTTVTVFPISWA